MSDGGPTITITRGRRGDRASVREPCDGRLPGPGDVASGLVQGARTAWLVGLGTFSGAVDVGGQLLTGLVDEGISWMTAPRKRTTKTAKDVARLRDEGAEVAEHAEEEVRKHMSNALRVVGVAPAADVRALREKINTLAVEVDRLNDMLSEGE